MLKQQDMTETAAAVLHFLPAGKWVTPRMMTRTTGVSEARCQLILTQLVLAGVKTCRKALPVLWASPGI